METDSGEAPSRAALRGARRVLVKAGTSVVANDDGRPSLTRLGSIVEQISELVRSGVEVIFVSSGAVGMGKLLLRKQQEMHMSFNQLKDASEHGNHLGQGPTNGGVTRRYSSFVDLLRLNNIPSDNEERRKKYYDSACAAAGQFEMMNLYSSLFAQCEVAASQLLLTQNDFQDEFRLQNLTYAVDRLLKLGIVPIINENDAVSANLGYTADHIFSDNDSLAALCARSFKAEVLLLLTDVPGVYDRPPSEEGAKKLDVFRNQSVAIGEKGRQGRGGMASKIEAALAAVRPGSACRACVVTAGSDMTAIRSILNPTFVPPPGPPMGTLFVTPGSDLEKQVLSDFPPEDPTGGSVLDEAREKATKARDEARKLQALPYDARKKILNSVAEALVDRKEELLAANALDLAAAEQDNVAAPLVRRLKLTESKLQTLAAGIRQLAEKPDPLGVVRTQRELSEGLELSLVTVPIGVLMIIFESRPDSMPQISSLALASGNGLLLKGGKEATKSNAALHAVIGDAIEAGSDGQVRRDIIALITSRAQVADMLNLDDVIDLVIPRGSNSLVSYIKAHTKIPVLGHADGICHVYVEESADSDVATKIVVDSKTDYPAACNAMETLLLHEPTLKNGVAASIMMGLRAAGVRCLGGPRAMKSGLCDVEAIDFHTEYGELACTVEVVGDLEEAVEWIHKYGSGHTDTIVCGKDSSSGEEFLRRVDGACVFKNASTRFADGYRFGLGAEVGISTGRIHSRGPVGVEGLLTTKWQLRSSDGDYVGEFGGPNPKKHYTHKELM